MNHGPALSRKPPSDATVELAERVKHQRDLIRDLWEALQTVIQGICLARAADDLARRARIRAEYVALVDIVAEGIVLGDALARGKIICLTHEDFAWPHHRALALAVITGHIADELLWSVSIAYRRDLLRTRRPLEKVGQAYIRVGALSRQRRALMTAEAACAGLRRDGCEVVLTAAELRAAADILEGRDTDADSCR